MAQRHTQWRNKLSNSFVEVYGWGCAFPKGVKIAQWGKVNECYTLWQKVGIILDNNFCYEVFWFRPMHIEMVVMLSYKKPDSVFNVKVELARVEHSIA